MSDEKNELPLDENNESKNGAEANNINEKDETGEIAENQDKSAFKLNIADLDANVTDENENSPVMANEEEVPLIANQEESEVVSGKKKKTKKKHGCLIGVIYIACIVAVSVFIAWSILITINDMTGISKPDADVTVYIPKSAKTSDIANVLKKNGLIDIPLEFRIFSKMTKADGKYQYGYHNLNKSMGYSEIVKALEAPALSTKDEVSVAFPEGYTLEQIATKLEDNKVCDSADFITATENVTNYDFIKEIPNNPNRMHKLEGYLFPDTYTFYIGESADAVVKKILDNFQSKITPMLAEMKAKGLTYDKMLTIASIVQAEGLDTKDMPDVASVFYNRLNNPSQYPFLQSDATVLYVMSERKIWLNADDISNPSPYNTYNHKGLPPGPICNPGLDAIKAAIDPSTTQYYFFVTDSNDVYYFAKTDAEHEKNVENIKNAGNGALGTNVAQ